MDKKSCEWIQDSLLDYEEGFLSEEESASVREHLDACSKCREYLQELKSSWDRLGCAFDNDVLEPAADFKVRFWKSVGQEDAQNNIIKLNTEAPKKESFWKGHYKWTAAAAAAAFILGGVSFGSFSGQPETAQMPAVNSQAVLNVQSDGGNTESRDSFDSKEMADEFVFAEYDGEWDGIMSQELLDFCYNDIAEDSENIDKNVGGAVSE